MSSLLKYTPLSNKKTKRTKQKCRSFHKFLHYSNKLCIPFQRPTKIQIELINSILGNKSAIFLSNTGSGKSYGYLLGLAIKYITNRDKSMRAVVVLPTKELVAQMYTIFKEISKNKIKTVKLTSDSFMGGCAAKLKDNPSVVMTTVGMFKLIDKYDILILDEVDLLMREGLKMDELLDSQIICTSATLDKKYDTGNLEVINMQEEISKHEINLYMRREEKIGALRVLLGHFKSLIVFVSSRIRVDEIVSYFKEIDEFKDAIAGIHGDMNGKLREENCMCFKNRRIQVLVVTDVAARGLCMNADCVINYDIADDVSLIHRRGRIRKEGHLINFYTSLELKYVNSELYSIAAVETKSLNASAEKSYEKLKRMIKKTTFSKTIDVANLPLHYLFQRRASCNDNTANTLKDMLHSKIDEGISNRKAYKQETQNKFKDQFFIPYSK